LFKIEKIKSYIKWILLSALVGVLAGLASGVFLILLDIATRVRNQNQSIIWLLPFAGFFIGYVYSRYGKESSKGNNLIIDEIHNPKKIVLLRMAPLVFFGTIITHLFGGSAGREGTAVQLGATLSDQISKFLKLTGGERKILLTAGAGAGFGAAIGAPWAGVLFGMEFLAVGHLRLFAIFQCLIASFTGHFMVHILGAPHMSYTAVVFPEFQGNVFLYVAIAGIAFGLSAQIFSSLTHLIERISHAVISGVSRRAFVGGVILVALYYLEGSYRYAGLGLEHIQNSLSYQSELSDPVLKIFFTAITLGFGFKGGEFTPLVFIGATLGSFLGGFFPVHFSLFAALGFAAVFGAAANTPLACTIMAIELFGIEIAPYAILACFVAYYFSGNSGIYSAQKIYMKKHMKLYVGVRLLGELPVKFLNGKLQNKKKK
jgi:H+/Cl- antiporter ClcA